jgi:uncharacterized protein (TIGR02246 family)
MSDSLERRIQVLEDRHEIGDLVARYCIALDDRDLAAVRELYAAEGVYTGPGGRREGREEVVAYLDETLRDSTTVHSVHQHVIDFDEDDSATGVVAAHVELLPDGAEETLFGALRYRDRYVRQGGRWRLLERTLTFVHLGPWSAVGTSLSAGEIA